MGADPLHEAANKALEAIEDDEEIAFEDLAEEATTMDIAAWSRQDMMRRHAATQAGESLNKRYMRMSALVDGATKDRALGGVIADDVDRERSRVLARLADEAVTKSQVNTVELVQLAVEHANDLDGALAHVARLEEAQQKAPDDPGLKYFLPEVARRYLKEVYSAGPPESLQTVARKRAW